MYRFLPFNQLLYTWIDMSICRFIRSFNRLYLYRGFFFKGKWLRKVIFIFTHPFTWRLLRSEVRSIQLNDIQVWFCGSTKKKVIYLCNEAATTTPLMNVVTDNKCLTTRIIKQSHQSLVVFFKDSVNQLFNDRHRTSKGCYILTLTDRLVKDFKTGYCSCVIQGTAEMNHVNWEPEEKYVGVKNSI